MTESGERGWSKFSEYWAKRGWLFNGQIVMEDDDTKNAWQVWQAAFEAGRGGWISVGDQPVPADKAVMVTNDLGEVCPMIRGIIANWVAVADWTWGHNVTAWREYPAPPDSGDTL